MINVKRRLVSSKMIFLILIVNSSMSWSQGTSILKIDNSNVTNVEEPIFSKNQSTILTAELDIIELDSVICDTIKLKNGKSIICAMTLTRRYYQLQR